MDFTLTERQAYWRDRIKNHIDTHLRPRVADYKKEDASGDRWKVLQVVEEEKVKAKAAERLAKVERVLAVAERAARGALDYGFAKAKEAELVSSSAPAAVTASAPKPGPALFARA